MTFQVDDAVRVVRLVLVEREIAESSPDAPPPRPGDVGVVVADVGDGYFLVECRTDDGITRWTAEFAAKELELVDRPDDG